jgi:prolyl-tRNA editing enzyme YbaK/EbsC (Cys-tRNA(Pro) deacylase)
MAAAPDLRCERQPRVIAQVMANLPESAKRFAAAASEAGLDIEIVEMGEPTRTAEEAARACGCTVEQIIKSLVFMGRDTGQPYLLLVSGANRVDESGAAAALGERLRRPDAQRVRELTGYAIGGIPPLGHATALPTLIDERLRDFDVVWAAAGTPRCVFSVDPRDLRRVTGAKTMAF